MKRRRWDSLAAMLVMGTVLLAACARRAPGDCREDVDCAPGFDCVGRTCAKRERLRFGAGGAAPAPSPPPPAPPSPAVEDPPATVNATPDGRPAPRKPAAAPRHPAAEPAAPPSPSPPPEPLPAWKQRLKNS